MRGSHVFSRVPSAEIQRSSFDRSSGHKTTFDAGYLIPIFVDEALPGDTFNLSMTGFGRLATPIFPIMDNAYLESFWFFVPYRLVWENWERFNGAQDDPDDSTDFLVPQAVTSPTGPGVGSLQDYFGIPPGVANMPYNALAIRSYWLIWNEWFRDQNLQDSIPIPKDDGPDGWGDGAGNMARRGKRHDYFTSALPWPQKGDAVELPITGTFPVTGTGNSPTFTFGGAPMAIGGNSSADGIRALWGGTPPGGAFASAIWDNPELEVVSTAAATINSIRQAFQIQRLLERDARGGSRYVEILRSHFGVISPDQRHQRPEFLGSGSSPVVISQVPNTTSDGTTPQGNLAAYGTVTARNHGFTQSFTEHGIVIGLVSVRADLTYQQGLERFWSRRTRYDFYWPALAHLGEQAILNQEIFCQAGGTPANEEVFGYQERYAEMRYKPSRLSGLMRSNAAGTLDSWHLAQDFAALPVLDSSFIQEDPPFDRVIAVNTEPHFIFDGHIALRCARPMPLYGVPGLIDHF